MIKVQVFLQNDCDQKFEEVVITKDELLQLACNKAKEKYFKGHWRTANADELEIQTKVS